MKTLLALLLLTTPALAGETMTVSIGGVSQTWTLSDTDQQKFEAWVQFAYKCTNDTHNPNCTPYTLEESETLWAQATLLGTSNNVQSFQNNVAARAAIEAGTPVGFTAKGLTVQPPSKSTTKK